MRLAIVNLTGGDMSEGYKKYLKNMLPLLSSHSEIEAILCASPKNISINKPFNKLEKVKYTYCNPFSFLGRSDTLLFSDLEAFQPEVIFIPMERYFRYKDVPIVCMFQNMLPLVKLQHISITEFLRNKAQRLLSKKSANRSKGIIAVSSFVSEYLQSEWNIDHEKIGVVYHGVDVPSKLNTIAPQSIPVEWDGNFIFIAGAIETYRGLEDIFIALNHLRQSGYGLVNVVIAGPVRPAMASYFRKLKKLVNKLGMHDTVKWVGLLNEYEMSWCYIHSHVFIMTSRVEACPNTALEAMSHGSMIISSNSQPMPEIFSDTATYYETGDTEKLARCIIDSFCLSLLEKKQLSQKTILRSFEFSWNSTVFNTIEHLKNACS
jgi:glycosyltransferase involved in cell wall biosynthesis